LEPYIRAIIYNTCQIACTKNRFGRDLSNCTKALAQTVQIIPEYPERDKLISQFVKQNYDSLVRETWVLIKRDGKIFDPPDLLVSTLTNLVGLDPAVSKEASELSIICLNQKKRNLPDVSHQVVISIRQQIAKFSGMSVDPKLKFPLFFNFIKISWLFGNPKIVY